MDGTGEIITALLVAAGLGAVVGLERQTSHRGDPDDYVGARTFALLALIGALGGFSADEYGPVAWFFWALAALSLILGSYVFASRATGDWGTTTEAGAVVTFGIGSLVWADQLVPAVALTVGTVALLGAKEPLHKLGERFSQDDVRAVVQFGVITAIILPLLPDDAYGPFDAFNPRETWLMVVLVSAVGLAGYIGLRIKGSGGLIFTGLVGGLISSTAVTLGFSRMSREEPSLSPSLTAGILSASGLMYFRVLALAYIVAPTLGEELMVPLVGLGVFVAGGSVLTWLRASRETKTEDSLEVKNPLSLSVALQFGALYALVVFVAKFLLDRFSASALNVVGALSGINDVDAINLSMANLVNDGLAASSGARTVLIAVAVNTAVKAGMVVGLGNRRTMRSTIVILSAAAVGGVVVWAIM